MLNKPMHHKGNTQKNLSFLAPTFGPTHQQLIKLNHIKGNAPESCAKSKY